MRELRKRQMADKVTFLRNIPVFDKKLSRNFLHNKLITFLEGNNQTIYHENTLYREKTACEWVYIIR